MASYRGHLTTSTGLGIAYGALSWWQLNVDWPIAAVGGVLTAVGGLLPDLDSDSGVPVREMSHLTATVVPVALLRRIIGYGLSAEQTFLTVAGLYAFIRYIFFSMFRKLSVHRGMYHSIPAMLIAGLATFLVWEHPSVEVRAYFAVATMLGFLSHLVLDELCAVDFSGVVPHLNAFAGTAVKFWSPSMSANAFCYALMMSLGYVAYTEVQHGPIVIESNQTLAQGKEPKPPLHERPVMKFLERPDKPGQLRWKPSSPPPPRPENGVPLSIPNGR